MKRWRVITTCSVAGVLLAFICLVPVPISRIRGAGIVEAAPEAQSKLYVSEPGTLEKLNVHPGQTVTKGYELAVFTNQSLQLDLDGARSEVELYVKQEAQLEKQLKETSLPEQRIQLTGQLTQAVSKKKAAQTKQEGLMLRRQKLVVLAPRDGVVGIAPRPDDVGKYYEVQMDANNPFCTINDPSRLRVVVPLVTPDFNQLKETVERLNPAARETLRHLWLTKVSGKYEQTPLKDILADLQKQVPSVKMQIDPESDLRPDLPISFSGERVGLAALLDKICGANGLGYIVVTDDSSPLNGRVLIRPGSDRIFPGGVHPVPDLDVQIRIQGRDAQVWHGKIEVLPQSDATTIPIALSSRGGGPVPVKAERTKSGGLLPQTQYYLVYIDMVNPDNAIVPGSAATVKIYCKPETIARFLWRTVNNMFDLNLM